MSEYNEIRTAEDVIFYQNQTEGLHDGVIISAEYRVDFQSDGIESAWNGNTLTLKVLATGMTDVPVVELVFDYVKDLKIAGFSPEIFESVIEFRKPGIIWKSELSEQSDYVKASTMRWRICREE